MGWFKELPGKLLSVAGMIAEAAFGIGKAIIMGYIDGVKRFWSDPIGLIKDLGTATIRAFKSILGIASPSKVFAGMGEESFFRRLDLET